jgi:hypothetical protein
MDATRRAKFEALMGDTRKDIQRIEEEVEKELAAVKERLADLQGEKDAQMVIYAGYCQLLGVPNDLDTDDDED